MSAAGSPRLAQQVVASVSGLTKGQHTIKLVKTGGTYMVIDGFTVVPDAITPAHDITFRGLTFAYTTWTLPSTAGYIDNQAGVLWDPGNNNAPLRIPAAVQVHRGSDITFDDVEVTHTGGTGIDLADGTQDSTITGSYIHDTSGGGVSVGEVDDYYLTDTNRMTTGDTVSQNWISDVGQDYSDAVGIWAGYTRDLTISHNDIGHTPYSGMSLGWGWGYASPCSMQPAQGQRTCAHGTIYAGDNQILNNHVHDVMSVLHDGGPIYTNGGQGNGDGSTTSVLAGNLVEVGNHSNNRLYQDEGSSYWNTYNNLTRMGGNNNWIGMWTPTIHDINIHDNYSDTSAYNNKGTNITFNQATIVSGGAWPSAAQAIIDAAGPDAVHQPLTGRVDDDTAISYTGSWTANGNRGYGDYEDAVHATGTNGDTASLTFTGTAVSVIGEKNSDQGQVEIFLDATSKGLIDTSATTRSAQAVIYSTSGLSAGSHTIKVVKRSGTYATLDGFNVTGVHNDTNSFITYTGASWRSSANRGFGDYQDDVHATTANGDSATVTFTGTGISLVTETNSDEGTIAVSLDGTSQGTVNAFSASRQAQQTVFTVSGLPLGRHTLTLTKTGGSWLVIDRFDVR